MPVAPARVLDRITELANSPRRDRGATRAIYSYPAKFQAHLPAELIRLFTVAGDLVVDPFSGGGTTGLEAFLAGRRFAGVDLNPFGCLLARVKTTPIDEYETARTLDLVQHPRCLVFVDGGRLDSRDQAAEGVQVHAGKAPAREE